MKISFQTEDTKLYRRDCHIVNTTPNGVINIHGIKFQSYEFDHDVNITVDSPTEITVNTIHFDISSK